MMPVGAGARHFSGPGPASAARQIVDGEFLAKAPLQSRCERAREDIGRAARLVGIDDLDRLLREIAALLPASPLPA